MVTTDTDIAEFDAYARRVLFAVKDGRDEDTTRLAMRHEGDRDARAVFRQCAATDCPNASVAGQRAWFNAYTGEGRDRLYCCSRCRRRTTQRTYRTKAKGQTT